MKSAGTSSSSGDATSRPERKAADLAGQAPCPACGLPPGAGRFGWGGAAPQAHPERCPVCERVVDHFPAGCVDLSGEFFTANRQEILRRILRCGETESARHPQERIQRVEAQGGHVGVWTSHARLARRIGDLLAEQFGGRLSYYFEHAPELLRVAWRGEAKDAAPGEAGTPPQPAKR